MRRSKIESCMHFVWATYQRLPLITEEIETAVYHCIEREVERAKGELLAIGGMPDHVHVALMFPATLSYSEFAQRVKGVPSKYIKDQPLPPEGFFRWQEGYAAFAVSRSHRSRVVAYVQNQKRHHAANQLWPEWEETDEEAP